MSTKPHFNSTLPRRRFLASLLAAAAASQLPPVQASTNRILRPIPSSGERIPVIGMGTWITFDVGDDPDQRPRLQRVLQHFFEQGGGMIDASPMYGSSEYVIGQLLKKVPPQSKLFAATKVWILGRQRGIDQMESSQKLWGIPRFDLMQIHNLLDWEAHWETLKAWKAEGRIRYVGVTTSHGRRHDELEKIMRSLPLDFVQFTYNLADREAEQRLLPLAQERKIAVIVNRPFQGGSLFRHVRNRALPAWANAFDCQNWAQFFLKFIVAHPAVSCAIPATSNPAHMLENMGAGAGRLPDAAMRQRMLQHIERL